MVEFYIREARPEDVQTIFDLIIELATYEKTPEQVKATPEIVGHRYPASAFICAYLTGKPGIQLVDLYVKESFRRLGIGKALFGRLGKIAQEKGCSQVDWVVLKWNKPSIDFYEKALDAACIPGDWLRMRLEGDKINNLDKFLIPN